MTGEVFINGGLIRSLVRTIDQTWNDGYELIGIPAIATQAGTLTIEVISTITDKGGCLIYDDFRIAEGAELFTEWATHHGVAPDQNANDDHDAFSNGFDFVFGLDPNAADLPFFPTNGGGSLIIEVPISGAALSQGFEVELMTSSDMGSWLPASDEDSGVTLLSDTSSKGVDGLRRYLVAPERNRLFWKHALASP